MIIQLLLVLLVLVLLQLGQCTLEDDKLTIVFNIEHSVDDGLTFTNRSLLSISRSSSNSITIDNKKDKNGIYDNDIDSFKSLLNNNGYYRIRVKSSLSSSPYITAAIPACELQKSGFKEDIAIHMDNSNNIVSLVYSSPVAALSKPCDSLKVKSPTILLSKLRIADPVNAQTVPLQAIGPKPSILQNVNTDIPSVDKDGNPIEQQQQQRPKDSWVRRNWYLIALGGYYLWRFTAAPEPAAPEKPNEQAAKKNN